MESLPQAQAHGPALIRLLARIRGADAPPPPHSLSARLSQWVDWRQAVALSAALDARPAPSDARDRHDTAADDGECARVRAALIGAIEKDRAFARVDAASPAADDAPAVPADPAFYRQRYVVLQQMMEAEVGHLRGRLRGRLVKRGGQLGRLAATDAVMERALGLRERALLAPLPDLLAGYFERLAQAARDTATAAGRDASAPSTPWLDRFRHDMQRLLLAELDFRMQPTQGLLAALRTAPGPHAQ